MSILKQLEEPNFKATKSAGMIGALRNFLNKHVEE